MPPVTRLGVRHFSGGAVIAVLTALAPVAAGAQSTPSDRIDAIERQIHQLQGDLQGLKQELADTKQQLRQSRGETQRARAQAEQAKAAATQAQREVEARPP